MLETINKSICKKKWGIKMINRSFIKVKSSFGYEIENLYFAHSSKANSIVIIFPGSDYSCDKPVLHYARKAALLSGCDVLSLEYGSFNSSKETLDDFLDRIIKESYEAVQLCLANTYENIYFISKSLGTIVAGEISELIGYKKINNLFLTPIKDTTKYIMKSNCSIVVGTNDKFFSRKDIDNITNPYVDIHIVEGAVHSLEVDDYIKSIQILSDVTKICADFVKHDR